MKIQFEMTIDFPEKLEQEIAQDKEAYMKELLEVMQEGCRAEKVPMSVKFINTNDKVIEYLKKISRYATDCGNDEYFHYDAFQTYIQHLIKELGGKDE